MRDLTGGVLTASTAGVVRPVLLLDLILDSGTVRLNNSDRNFTVGGNLYLGVARLGAVSSVEDTAQLQSSVLKMSLSGIGPQFLTQLMAENYQGRTANLYLALLDSGYRVIDDPTLIFRGIIDQVSVSVGEAAVISMTAQNELARWETPRIRRYTDADQQSIYPGDTGLRWVTAATEREIYWGKAPISPISQSPGGAPRATVTYTAPGGSGDMSLEPGEAGGESGGTGGPGGPGGATGTGQGGEGTGGSGIGGSESGFA